MNAKEKICSDIDEIDMKMSDAFHMIIGKMLFYIYLKSINRNEYMDFLRKEIRNC